MILDGKFEQARSVNGGFVRVSATHPVDLFVGVEEGRRSIFLICPSEPPESPVLEAIEVMRRKREDGRWGLMIQLIRPELAGMFAYLASDLVDATTSTNSADAAAAALVERLRWWQRLLSKGRSTALGDDALRGLVGELLFLADEAIPARGPVASIEAWVGPFEAPRDFKFEQQDVEVKTVWRDSSRVRISSIDQLEPAGVPIALAIVILESSTSEGTGCFSCAQLVDRVRTLCSGHESAVSGLQERLWAVGYVDLPDYEKVFFTSRKFAFYRCNDEFPRIRRSALPIAVQVCRYEIALDAIAPFALNSWRIGN